MKTDDLIRAMAADTTRTAPARVVLPFALAAGTFVAALTFYAVADVRPDLAEALRQAQVIVKQTFPPLMAVAAFGATLRLARPERDIGLWRWSLLLAPLLVAAMFVWTAAATPLSGWFRALMGHSVPVCLTIIPLISAPILVATIWALRRGASVRPELSAALAGLLAGSTGATVYAFYCDDDSPMFWGVWYVLAIGIVVWAARRWGTRWLRW